MCTFFHIGEVEQNRSNLQDTASGQCKEVAQPWQVNVIASCCASDQVVCGQKMHTLWLLCGPYSAAAYQFTNQDFSNNSENGRMKPYTRFWFWNRCVLPKYRSFWAHA